MPTQEQIERAARAWWNHDSAADVYGSLREETRDSVRANARAALLAARPTPDEHERGVEAAAKAYVVTDYRTSEDAVCWLEKWWANESNEETKEAYRRHAREIIAAYLAATGGGNG